MPSYKFYCRVDAHYGYNNVFTSGSDNLLWDGNWHQMYPGVDRDLSIEYDIWDHKYRRKLKGDIVFMNRLVQHDYDTLADIKLMSAEVKFRISQNCGTTTASDFWEGYFSVVDGKWDLDRGLFTVTPTVDDDYREFLELGDTVYNVLDLTHDIAPILPYSTTPVEIRVCNPVLYELGHAYFEAENPDYPNIIRKLIFDDWDYYARCDDDDPESTCLIWRKHLALFKVDESFQYDYGDGCYSVPSCDPPDYTVNLNARGILLRDVVQYIVTGITGGIPYKSSFFHQDNWPPNNIPYGTGSSDYMLYPGSGNNYVTGETDILDGLVIYQKSDIKPTTDPAPVGNLTFNELMEMLKNIFNVDWFVSYEQYLDETEGLIWRNVFRIEHLRFWEEGHVDTDLTTLDNGRWDHKKNKFSYDMDNMPSTERFRWMEAWDVDFWGRDIIYDRIATRNRYKDNVLERTLPVTTDLSFIISNFDRVSNDGWVLLCVNDANEVVVEEGKLSQVQTVNAHLSWANLHYNYWRWGRVIETGNMNGSDYIFESYQRKIKQVEMTYPDCCDGFDPMAWKRTEMGDGEVREATYRLIDGTVKSVFFYLDVTDRGVKKGLKTGYREEETYHISIQGYDDIMYSYLDKLIYYP